MLTDHHLHPLRFLKTSHHEHFEDKRTKVLFMYSKKEKDKTCEKKRRKIYKEIKALLGPSFEVQLSLMYVVKSPLQKLQHDGAVLIHSRPDAELLES